MSPSHMSPCMRIFLRRASHPFRRFQSQTTTTDLHARLPDQLPDNTPENHKPRDPLTGRIELGGLEPWVAAECVMTFNKYVRFIVSTSFGLVAHAPTTPPP